MAIYGVAGKPGSGKSYWAVNHIITKFFHWDKTLGEYFPKQNVSIITNIEGLRLDHHNLDEMIKKAGGINAFFTVEYQKELLKRFSRIVYLIDESGSYFPAGFKDDKVIFLFQYHRHLGLDFYLVAPGVSNICPQIVRLMEYRLQASPRSKRLTNEFRYQKIVEGDNAGKQVIPFRKEIFRLYRSMEASETEPIKNVSTKYLVIAVCCMLFTVLGGYFAVNAFYPSLDKKKLDNKKASLVTSPKKEIEVKKSSQVSSESAEKVNMKSEIEKTSSVPPAPPVSPVFPGLRPVGSVSFDEFLSYERVVIQKNEGSSPIIYLASGKLISEAVLPALLNDSLIAPDGSLFVKRAKAGESEATGRLRAEHTDRQGKEGVPVVGDRRERKAFPKDGLGLVKEKVRVAHESRR